MEFIKDMNLPDGCVVVAGSALTKTWALKNGGSVAWPSDTLVDFVRGEFSVKDLKVEVGAVAPGEIMEVSVPLAIPSGLRGEVRVFFRLSSSSFGRRFGPNFWVMMNVVGTEPEETKQAETESIQPAENANTVEVAETQPVLAEKLETTTTTTTTTSTSTVGTTTVIPVETVPVLAPKLTFPGIDPTVISGLRDMGVSDEMLMKANLRAGDDINRAVGRIYP
jgi:next-to-BRCA1 protein 1